MKPKELKDKDNIVALKFYSEEEQYKEIAKKIIELNNKYNVAYNQIAILVRKGKYIERICKYLKQYKLPYYTDSAEYFFESGYFEKFVETLKQMQNLDKNSLYDVWHDTISNEQFNIGFRILRRCANGNLTNISLSNILIEFLNTINFLDENDTDYNLRYDCYYGMKTILDDYDEIFKDFQITAKINGLIDFLSFDAIDQYKYHNFKDDENTNDAVQVLTVHKAKGLEYNTVFIPNLEDSVFPAKKIYGKQYWHVLKGQFEENKKKYESSIEDERKLFYVALTRAKERIFLYYELTQKYISQFLIEANDSLYLEIDENDLNYTYERKIEKMNTENRELEEYNEYVKLVKDKLHSYYYNANHFCRGIILEYSDLLKKGNNEIIKKAKELHLID